MAIKVIGAGLGRTATQSLKAALNQLGFGPCYHMNEVRKTPGHIEAWIKVAAGDAEQMKQIFANYNSTVDWPAASHYKELFAFYPDAKVILSKRETDKWWKSMDKTILNVMRNPVNVALAPDQQASMLMSKFLVGEKALGGKFDEASVKAAFEKHNDEVRRTIPKGQLLEFDPGDGWGPLCQFLGVPVPSEPYPESNKTEDFQANAKIAAK